ncbi:MAG TPA: cytochrome d ubiquinol oxidase subunit II, partial [Gemmatimonadales bacterium]|nr:cytochrome d ubiquinol oxidase subunit II [Gemmatimonadales bacterium]
MVELWYGIVALMLTLYVVLDGFDLGAGMLHRFVARTEAERRQVLAAIGPYWDGTEVWLLAAGGALFVAFPRALAAGLSGFYLAIVMVLWCLILRGISIEFRSHVADPLWRGFWDGTLVVASGLLALFFGAALGNLLRGLPLRPDGWFGLALFTDLSARPPVGILDWFTVLVGAFAVLALALQGALYLSWRTDGPVRERSLAFARRAVVAAVAAWPLVTWATVAVHPDMFGAFARRPLAWLGAAMALAGAIAITWGLRRGRDLAAFLGSSSFIAGLLVATAASLFPVMLRAVPDASLSLTAYAA